MTIELTDPAWELSDLAKWLSRIPDADQSTWQVICDNLKIEPGSTLYYDLMSTLGRRLERFIDFAVTINDPEIELAEKHLLKLAAQNFSLILHPNSQATAWKATKQSCLKSSDIVELMSFSRIARRHRPLRVVSAQERAEAIDNINTAINDLVSDQNMQRWIVEPMVLGLMRLRESLEFFRFFGQEAVIDKLVLFSRQAEGIFNAAKDESPSTKDKIWKSLQVVGVIVAIFTAPDQVSSAYLKYQGWATSIVDRSIGNTQQQLLLPDLSQRVTEMPSDKGIADL